MGGVGRGYSKIRKVIIKAKNNFKTREGCNSRIREGAVICSRHNRSLILSNSLLSFSFFFQFTVGSENE